MCVCRPGPDILCGVCVYVCVSDGGTDEMGDNTSRGQSILMFMYNNYVQYNHGQKLCRLSGIMVTILD